MSDIVLNSISHEKMASFYRGTGKVCVIVYYAFLLKQKNIIIDNSLSEIYVAQLTYIEDLLKYMVQKYPDTIRPCADS